ILDGENAWENYPGDGIPFLRALYSRLNDTDIVRTITPGEYVAAFGDTIEPLDEVFPGAWFSSNYATWIGEEEEATAWNYLWEVRDNLSKAERSDDVSDEALAAAYETMLFAEGSDWFWWYGDDQSSGNDDYFDAAYRELLGQVYDALGQDRPGFLSVPIIPETPLLPDRSAGDEPLDVVINGSITDEEWANAALFGGGAEFEAVYVGFTPDGMHLRVDWEGTAPRGGFDVYLGATAVGDPRPATLEGQLLGFGATHLYRWDQEDPASLTRAESLPGLDDDPSETVFGAPLAAALDVNRVEMTIPLVDLGELGIGDIVPFRIVAREHVINEPVVEGPLFPVTAPAGAQVPDISSVEVFLDVADPIGDDHGPGTYEYPSDSLFTPGSYDLTGGSVGTEGGDLVITLQTLATIANPWGSPNGLSIQTFDIYIDTDPGQGTGARVLIPGRNAALPEGFGYEYGITVEGWFPAIYTADEAGETTETEPTFRVITIGDKGRVIIRVPLELLGGGDPSTWGYSIVLMSQEGYPSSGVRRVRDVMQTAEQWRVGGAPGPGISHTRILDVLWPGQGVVEETLSDYTEAASVEGLGPDDFGQIPMLTAGG
ncbi:hypothetical protein HQ535_06290, partial [bacterium]|nr:hypothetical protein [bacterium]